MDLTQVEQKRLPSIAWEQLTLPRKSRSPMLSRWNPRHSLRDGIKTLLKGVKRRPVFETTISHAFISEEYFREGSEFRESLRQKHLFCLEEFSMRAAFMMKEADEAEKDPCREPYPLTKGITGNLFAVRKPDTYQDVLFISVGHLDPAYGPGIWSVDTHDPGHWLHRTSQNLFLKEPLAL
ncbi:MAG: hypothetical protein ACJKSS_00395 [Patescibacteria group bacterium UBA2103]